MIFTGGARAFAARRGWPIATTPTFVVFYMSTVNALTLAWAASELVDPSVHTRSWLVLGLLALIALAFEETASRSARLQLRLSGHLKRDMMSVWAVAGAIALEPGALVVLLVVVLLYIWMRQQRPAGEALHRKLFNGSTEILGALLASLALEASHGFSQSLPWGLGAATTALIGIAAYAGVNRILVTIVLIGFGAPRSALRGSKDDNLIELATLCLGGLVALAVVYQPWLALLVLVPMITLQRGSLVRELETAATIDAKTGLLNAVAWEHLAKREMARAVRENYGVGLLIIDVDRFKVVNDRFGHLAGDAVLRGVGKCLEASMREYDGVGRFGGEEFVAVLPNADDADAMVIAERTRAKVNQLRVSDFVEGIPEDSDLKLAVSIGVSCMPTDGSELAELLHAADGALYRAKAMGRNRVVLADRGAGDPFIRVSMN